MKWLVQEFLNNASNTVRIIKALEETETDYLLIRLNRDNSFSVLDKRTKLPYDNSKIILADFILNEQIMVYGSKMFSTITQNMNLTPGSFWNENFEFEVFRTYLGEELLNYEFEIGELWDLKPKWDEFFIRPTGNTKLFTGMTIEKDEFLEWQREDVRNSNSSYHQQQLMISPIQEIEAEFRFFVVNQEIVTYSSYKVGGLLDTSVTPSTELIDYTQKIIEKFPLAKAFVLDVAQTKNGCKVVEYNNINTSGLYSSNEIAFVNAINNLA